MWMGFKRGGTILYLNSTKLTDWMFWNCADVRVRLVGGVEKVCSWGGVEVPDATVVQGDCFPDSVTGVCGTRTQYSDTWHQLHCFVCWHGQEFSFTWGRLFSSRLTELVDSLRYSGGEGNLFSVKCSGSCRDKITFNHRVHHMVHLRQCAASYMRSVFWGKLQVTDLQALISIC